MTINSNHLLYYIIKDLSIEQRMSLICYFNINPTIALISKIDFKSIESLIDSIMLQRIPSQNIFTSNLITMSLFYYYNKQYIFNKEYLRDDLRFSLH
jgi:hypothetical protein